MIYILMSVLFADLAHERSTQGKGIPAIILFTCAIGSLCYGVVS